MTQEDPQEEQDTHESEALARGQVGVPGDETTTAVPAQIEPATEPQVVPVTAQVDAAVEPVVEPASAPPPAVGGEPSPADAFEPPAGAAGGAAPAADLGGPAESPLAADRRGAEQAEDPPLGAIAGAFVGAFVAAKLLGRLGGGDDD